VAETEVPTPNRASRPGELLNPVNRPPARRREPQDSGQFIHHDTQGRQGVKQTDKIDQLATALASAQAELNPAIKDQPNSHLRSKYADLSSCWAAIRECLPRHGLSVVQGGVVIDGREFLETQLVHASGQWIAGLTPIVVGDMKGISVMQAVGSAWTYARRYGLAAITGLTADDDDGHGAGHRPAEDHRANNLLQNSKDRFNQSHPQGRPQTVQNVDGKPKADFSTWLEDAAQKANARARKEAESFGDAPKELVNVHQLREHLHKWAIRHQHYADDQNWSAGLKLRALSTLFADQREKVRGEVSVYLRELYDRASRTKDSDDGGVEITVGGKPYTREPGED